MSSPCLHLLCNACAGALNIFACSVPINVQHMPEAASLTSRTDGRAANPKIECQLETRQMMPCLDSLVL